jgi:hypothetical protein
MSAARYQSLSKCGLIYVCSAYCRAFENDTGQQEVSTKQPFSFFLEDQDAMQTDRHETKVIVKIVEQLNWL